MNLVFNQDMSYALYEDAGNYFLWMSYGGAAFRETFIKLDPSEVANYLSGGQAYIRSLVDEFHNGTRRISEHEVGKEIPD